MAIRIGMITTKAMNDLVKSAEQITKDIVGDGSDIREAVKFVQKLAIKGARKVK